MWAISEIILLILNLDKMRRVIIWTFIHLLLFILFAIFIYPEPNKEYSGIIYGPLTGSLHGFLMIPNWIISFYDDTRLIKATSYSWWYNSWWWISAIGTPFYIFTSILHYATQKSYGRY